MKTVVISEESTEKYIHLWIMPEQVEWKSVKQLRKIIAKISNKKPYEVQDSSGTNLPFGAFLLTIEK